jgi:hypothetical protein
MRVPVTAFTIATAMHTAVVIVALIMLGTNPVQTGSNCLVFLLTSLLGVFSAYTTEARERAALLLDFQLRLANDAARNSGASARARGGATS